MSPHPGPPPPQGEGDAKNKTLSLLRERVAKGGVRVI